MVSQMELPLKWRRKFAELKELQASLSLEDSLEQRYQRLSNIKTGACRCKHLGFFILSYFGAIISAPPMYGRRIPGMVTETICVLIVFKNSSDGTSNINPEPFKVWRSLTFYHRLHQRIARASCLEIFCVGTAFWDFTVGGFVLGSRLQVVSLSGWEAHVPVERATTRYGKLNFFEGYFQR